jgi:hypothetical protein
MALGASYLLNIGPDGNGVIPREYEERLMRVAEWYRNMEECLECAQPDTFDYGVLRNRCIATKKNGKTYLHFYAGLVSNAVAIKNYPSIPKAVRLMNTKESLKYDEIYLPEFFSDHFDCFKDRCLHIFGINIDALENEPIVIEIEW